MTTLLSTLTDCKTCKMKKDLLIKCNSSSLLFVSFISLCYKSNYPTILGIYSIKYLTYLFLLFSITLVITFKKDIRLKSYFLLNLIFVLSILYTTFSLEIKNKTIFEILKLSLISFQIFYLFYITSNKLRNYTNIFLNKSLRDHINSIQITLLCTLTILAVIEFITLTILDKKNVINDENNELNFELYPYKHQTLPYIQVGMKGDMDLNYTHKDLNGEPYQIHYKTNNLGFRIPFDLDEVHKYSKKENEIVILITGGSTAYGVGSGEKQTIANKLSELLNRKYSKLNFTVLNFSIGAANAYQQYLALHIYGMRFKPDIIINIDGRNDGFNSIYHGYGVGKPNGYQGLKYMCDNYLYNQPRPDFYRSKFIQYLLEASYTSQLILQKKPFDRKNTIKPWEISFDETQKAREFYKYSINSIRKIENQIEYIFAIQPMTEIIRNYTQYENHSLAKAKELEGKLMGEVNYEDWLFWWFKSITKDVSSLTERDTKSHFVDFNKVFFNSIDDLNSLFIDHCHLTPDGNKLISSILFEIITRSILPKFDSLSIEK